MATPAYRVRKDKKAGVLVSPKEVTVLATVDDKQPTFHTSPTRPSAQPTCACSRVICFICHLFLCIPEPFYPTALRGSRGIFFTHGVWMGRRAVAKSLSRLHLRNCKV